MRNNCVRICLRLCAALCVAVCAAPLIAQNVPSTRGVNVDADHFARQGDGFLFFDDFADGQVDPTRWTMTRGVRPGDGRERSVRLGPIASSGAAVDLRTISVDLARVEQAELSTVIGVDGALASGELIFEYWNASEWRELDRVRSSSVVRTAQTRTVPLPPDAYHAEFRLRIRTAEDAGGAQWRLHMVVLHDASSRTLHSLTVDTEPARDADVRISQSDAGGELQMTPFTRWIPSGRRVRLLAPAEFDGWTFSRWTVNGRPRDGQGRMLALTLSEDVNAEAHFRPFVTRAPVVTVRFLSTPRTGVPLAAELVGGVTAASSETDFDAKFLDGEWIVAVAPLRTRDSAFVRWMIDGEPAGTESNELTFQIRRDVLLVAEYALLGDMNGDGRLDASDVDLFVLALGDPDRYQAEYPDMDRMRSGDVDGDGRFDGRDIEQFVDLVLGG